MPKLLLYCCKAKPFLREYPFSIKERFYQLTEDNFNAINGKIVAECDFEVEKIKYRYDTSAYKCNNINDYYYTNTLNFKQLEERSCLTNKDLLNYLGQNDGYAIHIKNLKIFDTPNDLREYTTRGPRLWDSIVCDSCTDFGFDCTKCNYNYEYQEVVKVPHNMMKVCEWNVEDKVLVPVKPNELCKILNRQQTILVRKKVLKEMLK